MTKRNNLGEYESTIGNGDTFLKSRQKQPGNFGGLNMNKKKKLTQTQERFGADSANDYIEEERKSYADSSQYNNRGYESDEGVLDQMPNFARNAFGNEEQKKLPSSNRKIGQSSKKKMKSIHP